MRACCGEDALFLFGGRATCPIGKLGPTSLYLSGQSDNVGHSSDSR